MADLKEVVRLLKDILVELRKMRQLKQRELIEMGERNVHAH